MEKTFHSAKNRIEYINLAKGLCMIIVVIYHAGAPYDLFPGMTSLLIPPYIILSGLFFKEYCNFKEFLVKKINGILIPFLFFYLVSYAIFYVGRRILPTWPDDIASGILDVFTHRDMFNGPLWFLLCLFWANLGFYAIRKYTSTEWLCALAVLICGLTGYYLGQYKIFVPVYLDVALLCMPLYYLGYMLKKTPLLHKTKCDKWSPLPILILYTISYFLPAQQSLRSNRVEADFFVFYISVSCIVLSLFLLSKLIGRLPIISYFGQYSLIILCIQGLIYQPLLFIIGQYMGITWYTWIIVSILTLALCAAAIPLCVRYLPYFTAQKDLIK